MNNLTVFESFAKGSLKTESRTNNCVVYTRVSTKEQADNNLSLDTQRKACEQYAAKNGLVVHGYFGGTFESAQTDERIEFSNMLSFVKKCREKISCILVYSVDRFSRSGANAIYIKEQLRNKGVYIISVTQQTDTATSSGNLQQNIQLIFSEYDNQLRKEKCMAGIKEMLLRGDWCTKPPLGYDTVKINGKRSIIVNDTGKLLKKAFHWKVNEQISNQDIYRRLLSLGLKINHQRISETFKNPFYCGLITHNLLEGQIVEGNHEKLVSKEVFLKVNSLLEQNHHNYITTPENDFLPLKRFLKCDNCNSYMRGYVVQKKGIHYYKCNNIGCNNNKNAKALHSTFESILKSFNTTLSPEIEKLMKIQMISTFNQLTEGEQETRTLLQSKYQEITAKLNRIEERFIEEEITKDLYLKYVEKFKEEKKIIEQTLNESINEVSNLELCVEKAISICSNLHYNWSTANYSTKQKIQFLLFPEGITYSKEKNCCRTTKINSVFSYIAHLAQEVSHKKSGIPELSLEYSALVAGSRIELPTSGL